MADYVKAEEEVERKSRGTASGGPKLSDDEDAEGEKKVKAKAAAAARAKKKGKGGDA